MKKTGGEPGAGSARTHRAAGEAMDASTDDPASGLEQTVAAYLAVHPDFFVHNPEVLVSLRVPHASGGATSLIEHQVKLLRRQLDAERGRLAQLITRAREYETLSGRLHALVLQLVAAPDLEHLQARLQEALMREFSAQAVTLKLFALDPADPHPLRDPLAAAFREFLAREHALCGPLDEEKNGILFGDQCEQVQCAALVPIRGPGCCGVLAIGAADPERFKPDMRTDMLDRLGEIVSHKLLALSAAIQPAAIQPAPRQPARAGAKRPRRPAEPLATHPAQDAERAPDQTTEPTQTGQPVKPPRRRKAPAAETPPQAGGDAAANDL
jgi:uncharacterized protein